MRWFDANQDFLALVDHLEPYRQIGESWVQVQPEVLGYCTCCRAMARFRVAVGPTYGDRPNLREGLVCQGCALSNRNRLMALAVAAELEGRSHPRLAVLEQGSPLVAALERLTPDVICSEYLDGGFEPGSTHLVDGRSVRHESITELSHGSSSVDLIVHCDVLEHVPDFRQALRECARVLRPGGVMLATVPFFMHRDREGVLAEQRADGSVVHLTATPELHGDPRRPEGILTFHHFGWGLLDDLRTAGFESARIGLVYDLFLGFSTDNHPSFDYGLMYPVLLGARVGAGLDACKVTP